MLYGYSLFTIHFSLTYSFMKSKKLNINWSIESNEADAKLTLDGMDVVLEFALNATDFEHIATEERGQLLFETVYAYRIHETTKDAYLGGSYRFKSSLVPWGGLYELMDSGWIKDFPADAIPVNASMSKKGLRHFVFFWHNSVFECVASDYLFKYLNSVDDELDDKYPKGYLNHYIAMFVSQFDTPSVDNFTVYTDLYIQMEGRKEFDALRAELKRIKANDDLRLYLKFANKYPIANFGIKQLDDMVRAIEGFKA